MQIVERKNIKKPQGLGVKQADCTGVLRARSVFSSGDDRPTGTARAEEKSLLQERPAKRFIQSSYLSGRQICEMLAASQFASDNGWIFNRFTTINLEQGGVIGKNALLALRKWLQKVREAVNLRGGEFAAIWCREVGREIGEHVHILLYISNNLTRYCSRRFRTWLKKVGVSVGKGVIKTVPVFCSESTDSIQRNLGRQNAMNVTQYILKCHSDQSHRMFKLSRKAIGGRIIGKRCGATRNLGPVARKRNGKI